MVDHKLTDSSSSSSSLSSILTSFFEQRNPIDRRIGLVAILFFLCFFFVLNNVVLYLTRSRQNWSNYWRWRNLLISWFHALICGSWDLTVFLVSFSALSHDMIQYQTMAAYLLVAFSTGYFLFDLYDMWIYRKVRREAGELWELVLHHISISAMFVYNMFSNQCIGYNVIALLAEVNSFFLHSRKLMQMAGLNFQNSRLYTANAAANIFTFVICRFGSMIRIAIAIATEYNRVSTVYLTCISSCMIVLWAINPVLLYRLVRADSKMWRGKLKAENGGMSSSSSYVFAAPYVPEEEDKDGKKRRNENGSSEKLLSNGDSLNNGDTIGVHHKHNGLSSALNGNSNSLSPRRLVQESRA